MEACYREILSLINSVALIIVHLSESQLDNEEMGLIHLQDSHAALTFYDSISS